MNRTAVTSVDCATTLSLTFPMSKGITSAARNGMTIVSLLHRFVSSPIAHYPLLALFMYAKWMLDEKDFQRKADTAFEELKRRMLTAGDEHGFDVEGESGKLEVIFEEPEEAKFVISPNTPVREIWVSALSTSFKLGWNESRNAFVHEKTGEDLRAVMSRVISQQLGAQVTL
jgi:iron donor protein CyaY